ncbi:hypothetical protein ACIA8G_28655 [Lentzea sp. NPDC051213]|uniref:hypothetical protein n=1 Tax=Lentzea sp. NPDC051213 TaxID=3364126 RepID=UPI0037BB7639
MTFDVAGNAVHGRPAAWRFIEGFAAEWAEPLEAADGWNQADLDAAEDRLGVRLPLAFREAYALFGRRPDLTSNQDRLLTPSELSLDGDVLVFRTDNQGVMSWGVKLDGTDPEAVFRHWGNVGWQPWLPSFSTACAELVLSESLFAGDETVDRELDDDAVIALEARYTRVAIPQTGPGTRWFAGPDIILRDDHRDWLWARTRSREALDVLLTTLPGPWRTD